MISECRVQEANYWIIRCTVLVHCKGAWLGDLPCVAQQSFFFVTSPVVERNTLFVKIRKTKTLNFLFSSALFLRWHMNYKLGSTLFTMPPIDYSASYGPNGAKLAPVILRFPDLKDPSSGQLVSAYDKKVIRRQQDRAEFQRSRFGGLTSQQLIDCKTPFTLPIENVLT